MIRVYVAGPYSASNVITVLDNIRNGMQLSKDVFLAGFAPFCPWLDYHFTLQLREGEKLTVEDYYQYSTSWLEASHAVLVLPNWEGSNGTKAEMARARELNIPIFYTLEALVEWRKNELSKAG